jgi:Tfp pilus assembly protein PilZ
MPRLERYVMYRKNRRHERVPVVLGVRYGTDAPDHRANADALSEAGLHIRSNLVCRVGTRIRLLVELPDGPFEHTGEVMWAIQVPDHLKSSMVYGMGIKFIDPAPAWTATFERWKQSQTADVSE